MPINIKAKPKLQKQTLKKKQTELTGDIATLKKAEIMFNHLSYEAEEIKEELKKVSEKQRSIANRYNQEITNFEKTKTDTYKKLNEKEDKAMTDVINSKKKYGFNSSYFTNVVAAINDYRTKRDNPENKESITLEKFDEISEKLYCELNTYISERKEGSGNQKSTDLGQQRLDAMRRLKQQLDMKRQQIIDFKAEEESIQLHDTSKLSVGTDFEKAVIEQNQNIKIQYQLDKTIALNVREKLNQKEQEFNNNIIEDIEELNEIYVGQELEQVQKKASISNGVIEENKQKDEPQIVM